MKFLNKIIDSSMMNEATDKRFMTDAEKTKLGNLSGTMITIADAGGYFTGTTTEAALQEIGATLDGLDAALEALL